MSREEARALMAALPGAREQWLEEAAGRVRAEGMWLAGSLGRGEGDEWSDVDLILVDGKPLLAGALIITNNPGNGPIGGGHIGALYGIGPLTLWVDWYLWPAHEPVPRGTKLLRGTGTQGPLDLSESLDHIGRGHPRMHLDREAFALAMLPLGAKFVARGDLAGADRMAAMLGAPRDLEPLAGLRAVLSSITGHAQPRRLVDRYLQVVEALTQT